MKRIHTLLHLLILPLYVAELVSSLRVGNAYYFPVKYLIMRGLAEEYRKDPGIRNDG